MGDPLQLLLFAFVFVLLVAGWFALASVSHNVWIQIGFGWIGFAVVALYYRWLMRHKVGPRK